jgi:hypothetical protein
MFLTILRRWILTESDFPLTITTNMAMSIERPRKIAVADGVTAASILANHIDKTGVNTLSDLKRD